MLESILKEVLIELYCQSLFEAFITSFFSKLLFIAFSKLLFAVFEIYIHSFFSKLFGALFTARSEKKLFDNLVRSKLKFNFFSLFSKLEPECFIFHESYFFKTLNCLISTKSLINNNNTFGLLMHVAT